MTSTWRKCTRILRPGGMGRDLGSRGTYGTLPGLSCLSSLQQTTRHPSPLLQQRQPIPPLHLPPHLFPLSPPPPPLPHRMTRTKAATPRQVPKPDRIEVPAPRKLHPQPPRVPLFPVIINEKGKQQEGCENARGEYVQATHKPPGHQPVMETGQGDGVHLLHTKRPHFCGLLRTKRRSTPEAATETIFLWREGTQQLLSRQYLFSQEGPL